MKQFKLENCRAVRRVSLCGAPGWCSEIEGAASGKQRRKGRLRLASLLLPIALLSVGATYGADAATEIRVDQSGPAQLANEFVSAFNQLDQARFDDLWAEDASVFFPQPPFPIRRVEGKAEVVGWFKRFMDAKRQQGQTLSIEPKELSVQMAGPDAAVVSFNLGEKEAAAGRRTLVLGREDGSWKIVHLHASNLRSETQ